MHQSSEIQGSAIYFLSDGDSLLTNCTFRNPGPPYDSMIAAVAVLRWACNLGQFTPLGGTIAAADAPFTGCAYECSPGTIGRFTNLTAADQCDACPKGQYCAGRGLASGQDCPVGFRMPSEGARTAESCLPCIAGQVCCCLRLRVPCDL